MSQFNFLFDNRKMIYTILGCELFLPQLYKYFLEFQQFCREVASKMGKTYSFEELLSYRGYIVYTCKGISMMPLLRQHRDIIEIRPKGDYICKKYDVVLYKRGEKYILHRILRVLPDGYIIAGDNNAFLEYDIKDEQIIGVMVRVLRDGREIRMTDKKYRLYVHIWCDIYPVRMFLLRIKRRLWRVGSHLKRK